MKQRIEAWLHDLFQGAINCFLQPSSRESGMEGGRRRVGVILHLDYCYFTRHGARQQLVTAPNTVDYHV